MKILICGDSTACVYQPAEAPLTGWGMMLGEFLPGYEIVNLAMPGRSTKSFLSEGRLTAAEEILQQGDLMLIQFTHNDASPLVWRHTDPWTSFQNNLSIFVDTARLYGAKPVLLTPVPRRTFRDGKLFNSHGAYPDAIKALAFKKNVPLLDVYAAASEKVNELGENGSLPIYMHIEPGIWPGWPDGCQDDTHTQAEGARLFARITAELLRQEGLV